MKRTAIAIALILAAACTSPPADEAPHPKEESAEQQHTTSLGTILLVALFLGTVSLDRYIAQDHSCIVGRVVIQIEQIARH